MPQTIDVVIPTHNRASQLDRLLKQLTGLCPGLVHRIIVVDNASTNETSAVLAKYAQVTIIRNEENVLSARARQQGWDACTTDYVCFIDDDNVLDDAMLPELASFLDHHPQVGMVAPVQYRLDNQTVWCAGGRIDNRLRVTHELSVNQLDEQSTFQYQPNVFMVRNQLRHLGLGFDWQNFPHNWSEQEYGHRLIRNGWEIRTCAQAVTYHDIDYRGPFTRINATNLADQAEARVRYRYMYANSPMVWLRFFFIVFPASVAILAFTARRDPHRWSYLRVYIRSTWNGFTRKG